MAGAKKQTPPPIDRPLSRAYLRNFTGWSTAYPPGLSDPTSCRLMENMMVTRDRGLAVRPGLRYMSYLDTPDMDKTEIDMPGIAFDQPLVGSMEPFYLNKNGGRALLFAVREADQTVGFRAMLFTDPNRIVFPLDHEKVGFYIPQGAETLNFSAATKYVSYLQIDNKILALSDAGDSVRLFMVGNEKVAKRLNAVTLPEWSDEHKPTVVHPSRGWIDKRGYDARRNELLNPSFEAGFTHWDKSAHCDWRIIRTSSPAQAGSNSVLQVWSLPSRKNLATSPLHNVSATGLDGWTADKGDPKLGKDGDWMKLTDEKGKNVFLARSAKYDDIEPGKKYHLAFKYELSDDAVARARVQFYRNNGSEIGEPTKFFPEPRSGEWVSPAIEAPDNAVTARVYLGADSTEKTLSWVKVKEVMFCRANEPTTFFSGASGDNFFWQGNANRAPSVEWGPTDITITSVKVPIIPGGPVAGSMHVRKEPVGTPKDVTLDLRLYDRDRKQEAHVSDTRNSGDGSAWVRPGAIVTPGKPNAVVADVSITIKGVTPWQIFSLDAGMIESDSAAVDAYFDGSTPSAGKITYSWEVVWAPHLSPSVEITRVNPDEIPPPEPSGSRGAEALINNGTIADNKYKMGFFYTFETELGESAPSKMLEVRIKRPQSNWLWLQPNGSNEPDPTKPISTADLCADQLVATVPQAVYNHAVTAGALRWHLYTFGWSDQDPVPVEATWAGSRELFADDSARMRNDVLPYEKGGWINITPNRKFTIDTMPLPSPTNRVNYTRPPKARTGLVAGDRIILAGDAEEPATVRWTTNRPGEFTKFTAHRGGGVKTLSSGNLHIPGSVVLWQNPQSVDTVTILCLGSDGTSICYYMAPADLTAQSSSTAVMGFEETTNTPGTMSPYGVLVHNNALIRPIDRALLKSTAQNYNINHKSLSDDISNMWEQLQDKQWILSAVHDNRLCFVVKNPRGEQLEDGCLGNEIWVYDVAGGESGTWSRFLIQASALRVIEYGARVFVGVVRPDGLYYLDPDARMDDYVLPPKDPAQPNVREVGQRPIPWFFEMNTQGANKAHDAWAHLQQVSLTLGDFIGSMDYGIRAKTINGTPVNLVKRYSDYRGPVEEGLSWESTDELLVRRDLQQWYFFARSVDGLPSSGQFNTVQYRYTPVSVNVGYAQGSVETFEYARNAELGNDALYANGVPEPSRDFNRM